MSGSSSDASAYANQQQLAHAANNVKYRHMPKQSSQENEGKCLPPPPPLHPPPSLLSLPTNRPMPHPATSHHTSGPTKYFTYDGLVETIGTDIPFDEVLELEVLFLTFHQITDDTTNRRCVLLLLLLMLLLLQCVLLTFPPNNNIHTHTHTHTHTHIHTHTHTHTHAVSYNIYQTYKN